MESYMVSISQCQWKLIKNIHYLMEYIKHWYSQTNIILRQADHTFDAVKHYAQPYVHISLTKSLMIFFFRFGY